MGARASQLGEADAVVGTILPFREGSMASADVEEQMDPVLLTGGIGRESFARTTLSRGTISRASTVGREVEGDISGRDENGNFIWWAPPMQMAHWGQDAEVHVDWGE